MLRLIAVFVLACAMACGQLVIPHVRIRETPSGTETWANVRVFGAPYDNMLCEFIVFLTPGLSRLSPTTTVLSGMWNGDPPPVGLRMEWAGSPITPAPGLLYDPRIWAYTGEVLPLDPVFGGASWAYAAMGYPVSAPIDIAVWPNPVGVEPFGWTSFTIGVTNSSTYGIKCWGIWSDVR